MMNVQENIKKLENIKENIEGGSLLQVAYEINAVANSIDITCDEVTNTINNSEVVDEGSLLKIEYLLQADMSLGELSRSISENNIPSNAKEIIDSVSSILEEMA